MPANTPTRRYPYPLGADPINIATDVQALAEAVDADVNRLAQGVVLYGPQLIDATPGYFPVATSFTPNGDWLSTPDNVAFQTNVQSVFSVSGFAMFENSLDGVMAAVIQTVAGAVTLAYAQVHAGGGEGIVVPVNAVMTLQAGAQWRFGVIRTGGQVSLNAQLTYTLLRHFPTGTTVLAPPSVDLL